VLTVVGAVVLVGSIAWTVAAAAGARLPGEESSGQASASAKVEFLLEQALAASGVDDASTAVKDYQAALAVQPDNVEALTGEGAVLIQAGRAADKPALRSLGEAQLRRAETVDPAYGPAYGDLGEALYAEGDYAAAIPQLRGYLEHTPVAARAASVGQELALAVARAGVSS
jgi:tetratricopeptide (TPR) repeat protein